MALTWEAITAACADETVLTWFAPFWNTMGEDVRAQCTLTSVNKGAILFCAGLDTADVYFCLRGAVTIYKEMPDGQLYEIAEDFAPTIIGETEALLDNACARGTVISSRECLLLHVPASVFRQWMHTSCASLYALTVFIVQKNSHQHSKERMLLYTSGVKRLAYLLVQQYEQQGRGGGIEAPSRTTMAQQTGLNPRTISRCINALERRGLITHSKRKVLVSRQQAQQLREFLDECV